jgi:hypothetical protein
LNDARTEDSPTQSSGIIRKANSVSDDQVGPRYEEDEEMSKTAVIEQQSTAVAITPMTMLQMAVEQGADLDKMEKLMALQERWEANEAKKSYVVAMTAFKSESIEIVKDRTVSYSGTSYKHASLHGAVTAAAPMLSKHGLSHTWKTEQGEGGRITVSCVITHEQGHSETTSLSAGADDSGKKNNIQAIASTVSYLERYTFLAATGLTAKDMDDDAGSAEPLETISKSQVADLEVLITEVGADKVAFLRYCKCGELGEILARNYKFTVQALEQKRKA